MITSVIVRPEMRYPSKADSFSPGEAYPEYPFDHVAREPNDVYAAFRELLAQVGLDHEHYGTPSWNPLKELVPPGSAVFVLCNFVYHRRPHESERHFFAKCTHGAVLRAVLDYTYLACGPTGRVLFGNSAVLACSWERVLADTGADRVARFYAERDAPIRPKDLRLAVAERSWLGSEKEQRVGDARDNVEFDLSRESLLTGLRAGERPRFRVDDYDPDRTESFHQAGSHRYAIHRSLLESDVVISVPKLKAHEKVGVTCALKGFVGTVSQKDCLAHHRFGSPSIGGDEYPDSLRFLSAVSRFEDWLNRRSQQDRFQKSLQIAQRMLRRVLRRLGWTVSGSWHGNDTAWRMALDIVRIAFYGSLEGTMGDVPLRQHLTFIDGIIGGEGSGPLSPDPVDAGALILSDDLPTADHVACRMMGFDPRRIPLVSESFAPSRYPVARQQAREVVVCLNGASKPAETLTPVLGRCFAAPSGWKGHVEATHSGD